jgi:hypothetical protein
VPGEQIHQNWPTPVPIGCIQWFWATDPTTGTERNRRGYTLATLTHATTTTERDQDGG